MHLSHATLVAAVLLAGCSGPMTVDTGSPLQQIDSFYNYAAADRDLALVIYGNSFAMPGDAFARMVEADVQMPLPRAPTHPTLTPGPSVRPNAGLLFVFQPAPDLSASTLCEGRAAFDPPEPGSVRALAAFCLSGRALTQVEGRTDADGAGDERFRELVQQMMLTLFRPDIRDTSHGGRGFFP